MATIASDVVTSVRVEPFRRVYMSDFILEQLVDSVERSFLPFSANPMLDGVLLEGATLTADVENLIEHGLGRDWRGWFLTDKQTITDVVSYTSTTQSKAKFLSVVPRDTVTVGMWIF